MLYPQRRGVPQSRSGGVLTLLLWDLFSGTTQIDSRRELVENEEVKLERCLLDTQLGDWRSGIAGFSVEDCREDRK